MLEILQKNIKMYVRISTFFIVLIGFLLLLQYPHITFAQTQSVSSGGITQSTSSGGPQNLSDYVGIFLNLYTIAVPILTGLAFLLFFWGVAKFILSAGNEKELANGRSYMIWGIIALFILITIWGIIQFMSNELNFNGNTTITTIPLLP